MIFDGPTTRIILEAGDGDVVAVEDIFDAWEAWHAGAGSAYDDVIVAAGGEDLGGGVLAARYFFLDTGSGWRIRPREEAHTLTLQGSLYSSPADQALFAPTLGDFQVLIQMRLGAGAPVISAAAVADAVWEHTKGDQVHYAVELLRRITDNRLEVDLEGQRLVLYDDDGETEIREWALTTDQGEDVLTSSGVQTRRAAPLNAGPLLWLGGDQDDFALELSGDQEGFVEGLSGDMV